MKLVQLCPLPDTYGYAGFVCDDEQCYQFWVTEKRRCVKRMKLENPFLGPDEFVTFLTAAEASFDHLTHAPTIAELTLEELDRAAVKMPSAVADCSWTISA